MRRRTLIAGLSGVAAAVLVTTVSVVWPGLDAKQTPPLDTSVWALQTGPGSRYARVNTAVGELDTVRSVSSPTAVVESASGSYLFSESYGRVTRIDAAQPVDLDATTLKDSPTTPSGTVEATIAGDYVAYRTDSGAVFTGTLAGGEVTQVDPSASADGPQYTSTAIGLDDEGVLYSYSPADRAVLRYDIAAARVLGSDPVAGSVDAEVDVVSAGDTWYLVDPSEGLVWIRDLEEPVAVELTGAVAIARASAHADALYLADEAGLVRLGADGAAPTRVVGGQARDFGTPARPTHFGGQTYAAWLRADGGVLWRSEAGEVALDFAGQSLGDERRPVFAATDAAMILNETRSGWVWTAPDGALVPSSQDWSLDDRTDEQSAPTDEQAAFVLDPRPPVAEPDAFGVRAGGLVSLPVLLNDHDPNTDVLTIDAASVEGLDPGFGTVTITDSGQRLAVRVDAAATGSATFSYRVTDGTSGDGLRSEPATVTITVAGEGNSAPQFCGVDGCLATWPEPQVEPGGTVSLPVLNGWVDPEGDPLLLLSVENGSGVGAVASTPAGEVVYQHPDPSAAEAQVIGLDVTVSDARGATTTKELLVRVDPSPALAAESFAVTESLESGSITVDVAPHVTGTAGSLALTAVRVLDDAPAQVVAAAGGTTFDFAAKQAGTYQVSYTVAAGGEPATALARITILPADAPAQLATAPVIAFVRPSEDATLDVFGAVSNPTRRVLLLSDVEPHAAQGASMTVDVVGQRYLRITGTTADGSPGLLGTVRYLVSDGTEDLGARVAGEATVYLLPPPPELAPIAVDDSVVVRAGAQLDIPVLDNDVAPSGGPLTLDPSAVASSTPDALAFASGGVLRYLAPAEPGDHRIDYAIFSTGSPTLADAATVRVTVIDGESNRDPQPAILEGRVLSGQSTTIPFDQFGVDPDGDQVALERILTQPEAGSATLSADGASIVYTSAPGDSGQRSFTYSVVDGAGGSGTGVVRVGVLDAEANPSPVTFTDYVQVQAGVGSAIRISPLANDVDPTGGRLTLTDVRPDIPQTLADGTDSPDYARQRNLIADVGATTVTINAGLNPGTMSFLYDLTSDSGNTARDMIVVKVVRDAVPDYPVVVDTVLTAETRDRFRSGVDVVSGSVTWSGGDVADLTLSLWGDPGGVVVDGRRLRGALPEHSRVIPFALTGAASSGAEVVTYGFLRIPGEDDYTLALRAGVRGQEVTERESVEFDMRELVAVPAGATLEVGEEVAASGARPGAACTRVAATVVRYDAAEGAPWADACIVPVRVAGQEAWTHLSVPVRITAVDPQPELHPASVTVGPGETARFDLKSGMTSWQWKTDWQNIAYALEHTGSSFDLAVGADGIVQITGRDAAVPGTEDVALVSVTSHPGVAPARLILRVGAAPSELPRGGTVAQQCSQAQGSSCTIRVVGASGEVNPLPRTPLELTDVRATGSCAGVSFERGSATTVVASWTADAAGATCTAAFTLRDAQGRHTSAARDGSLLLDLQGYPKAPAALAQAAYDDGLVTLRVDPGEARSAYPALTGFTVRHRGVVVATCAPDGACPPIAAPNGEARDYEAWAVNGVGESRGSVRTVAWAYDPPPAPGAVTAEPVVTGGEGRIVSLRVTGIDTSAVGRLEITSPAGETQTVRVRRSDTEVTVPRYVVGSNTVSPITVTPFSRFDKPPGFDGATSGSAVVVHANGIGAPRDPALQLSAVSVGDGTATVSATGSAQLGGDGSQLRYGFARSGSRCVVADSGHTAIFDGLPDGEEYAFDLCVESWYRGEMYGRSVATATVRAVQSPDAPRGYTFVVDAKPLMGDDRLSASWIIRDLPTSTETPPRRNIAVFTGIQPGATPMTSVFGRDPGIRVFYQHERWGTRTADAPVTARAGSAPYQVRATWRAASCVGGSQLQLMWDSTSSPGGAKAAVAFDRSGLVYRDAAGAVLAHEDSWLVPVGAVSVSGIGVTVSWSAMSWGLSDAAQTFSATCEPNLPPEQD